MLKMDNFGPEGHTKWSKVNAKKYMARPVLCLNSSHSHLILTFCDILLIVIMPLPVIHLLRKAPDHWIITNKSFWCNCLISTFWKSPDSWIIIFVQFLVFHLVCLWKSFCQLLHLLLKLPASSIDNGYKCHARYLLVIYHIRDLVLCICVLIPDKLLSCMGGLSFPGCLVLPSLKPQLHLQTYISGDFLFWTLPI